jgi:hypothetical protein
MSGLHFAFSLMIPYLGISIKAPYTKFFYLL